LNTGNLKNIKHWIILTDNKESIKTKPEYIAYVYPESDHKIREPPPFPKYLKNESSDYKGKYKKTGRRLPCATKIGILPQDMPAGCDN